MKLFIKQKQAHRFKKNKKQKTYGYQRGNGEEGVNTELGINVHTAYI